MRARGGVYFAICLLLLTAYVIATSLTFRYPRDRVLLVLAGSVAFVLSAVQLTRELRTKHSLQPGAEVEAKEAVAAQPERRRIGSALGWTAGLVAGVYVLGLIVAIPLFLFSYMKMHGVGWPKAMSLAAITTIIVYLAFKLGLKVALYPGVLLPPL